MNVQNDTLIQRTVKIPLSDTEEAAFKEMLNQTWQKKGGFLRLVILKELESRNLLPQKETAK